MNTRLLLDSLGVLLTRVVLRGANLVAFLLLARALSVPDFGFYGYVVATAVVLSVACDLGVRQSTAYLTGHEPARRAAVVTHMLAAALLLGALATFLCWAALAGARAEASGTLAVLGAVGTLPMLLLRTGQGAFLGGGQLARLNATELVSRLVLVAGTAGLYLADRLTLTTALWVLLLAHLAAALWLVAQLRADLAPRSLVDPALTRELFRRGASFAAGIVLLLILGRVGIWIVAAELGPEALGRWFGIQRLGEMLVEVATAVGLVLFSHGVRAADPAAAARDAARTARLVTAAMLFVGLAAGILAEPFLTLVLGAPYAAEATAFRVIMLGTLAACFNAMLYPSLGAQGLAHWGIGAYALGVAVATALTFALTPGLGLLGAALGYALAQAVVTAAFLPAYRRRFGLSAGAVLLPRREDVAALRAALRAALARRRRRRD